VKHRYNLNGSRDEGKVEEQKKWSKGNAYLLFGETNLTKQKVYIRCSFINPTHSS
jgi:hypothetical protein